MAKSLHDGLFWLPPEFLTDDDVLLEKTMADKPMRKLDDFYGSDIEASRFPYGFGFSSDLSSPVESVVSSTETESDEDDFVFGLTRQMAHSTLEEGFRRNDIGFGSENYKNWGLLGSPQSTLCPVGSACGCRQGSGRGSPNCQSRVSSTSATWDLLYAAAEEVARMRMKEESYNFNHNRGFLNKPGPNPNLDMAGIYLNQKLQAAQFQQRKQQQMMQQQNAAFWGVPPEKQQNYQMAKNRASSGGKPLGMPPSAWPPLQQHQQQTGSGMRAVFLGSSAGKKECAGTGVFLPRQHGAPTENRKKPGCSTVLLPARVVQALNLNLEQMAAPAQNQFQSRIFIPDGDTAVTLRSGNGNGNLMANQRRNFRTQQGMGHELRLPQEWTY